MIMAFLYRLCRSEMGKYSIRLEWNGIILKFIFITILLVFFSFILIFWAKRKAVLCSKQFSTLGVKIQNKQSYSHGDPVFLLLMLFYKNAVRYVWCSTLAYNKTRCCCRALVWFFVFSPYFILLKIENLGFDWL